MFCNTWEHKKKKKISKPETPSQLFSLLKDNHACIYDSS